MNTSIKNFGIYKQSPAFEIRQRQQNLNLIVWVVIFTSIAMASVNFLFGDVSAGLVLLSLAPICAIVILLNKLGYFNTAAILLCVLMLFILDYDIYAVGGLIFDLAPIAFPVIIIVCALLFDKKGIFVYSIACIISVIVLGEMSMHGFLQHNVPDTDIYDILTAVILIVATGLLLLVIIENAEENLARIQADEHNLRVSYELTLEGLVKAIELRDLDTEQHSQRVVSMSVRLASYLGLNAEELLIIKRGALLHDIGKIAVPDNILRKPGPLTEEEWAIMRQHPVKAREILSTIPFLANALDIPYSHHENWDGTGYPSGLRGKEIPLFARIFSIVDQWEALTSNRSYHKGWSREQTLSYIQANTGKLFDPEIVDAFFKLIEIDDTGFLDQYPPDTN